MCGIAGIYNFKDNQPEKKILHRMDEAIKHRGPDAHGEYYWRNSALACRRLAIIDVTRAEDQPLLSKDGSLAIVFNGEIFNYRELRRQFLASGSHFVTGTDTEVILEGYRLLGERIVTRLRGQFAFCILDKKINSLFLARDHLGINPLFYASDADSFLFSSEVKGILASRMIKKEIDALALHHYLSFFMIPSPLTILRQVKSLLPGYTMKVDRNGIKLQRYRQLKLGTWQTATKKASGKDLKERLKTTLSQAVARASVADVPVGAFLSGGIDSSLVVSQLAQQSRQPVKTYTLFSADSGEAFDERKYASMVANRYGTDHHEVSVSEDEVAGDIRKIIRAFDQPTGGSLETYYISKAARCDVKVALCGLGGDELFAGYHEMIYKFRLLSKLYRKIPSNLRHSLKSLINNMTNSENIRQTINYADKFLAMSDDVKKRLFYYFVYTESEKLSLYRPDYPDLNLGYSSDKLVDRIIKNKEKSSIIDKLAYFDLTTYTRDDLLLGTNMTGMANGLEIRVPLLDLKLLNLSAEIPPELKYNHNVSKFIFREIAREWLPKEIITHKKTGFGLPRVKYMQGKLKPLIADALSISSIKKRGYFDPLFVQKELDRHDKNRDIRQLWREHLRIWILFVFELWCREFIDN